ncbi:MAG: hypothetical protein J1E82_04235 [Muribaculaceae bacterium]|nr:hypothetical protein [Muribaculaceae bacterium]
MKLQTIIIKLLSEKANIDVTTKTGAEFLRNDIEAKTGEALSLNTVKRLVGILPYESSPREVTRDILAKYLGYDNWNLLNTDLQNKISDFNRPEEFIDLKELPINSDVVIKWSPDREIKIHHIQGEKYEILEARNSKLQKEDIIFLSQIAIGFPFIAKEVVRGGNSLGNYTAARVDGVYSIEIIDGE